MRSRTNLKTYLVISVFLVAIWPAVAAAGIIYVDADANGANDGTSWCDAYNHLQDALNAARSGDEIWVAECIYKPDQCGGNSPGDRYATFRLKNGVAIKGGYAGCGEPDPNARDVEVYETILSGDLANNDVDVNDPRDLLTEPTRAENSFHVVTGSSRDATAVLDGFTITGGNANGGNYPDDHGGGMFNESGSPKVINCVFIANTAYASIGSGAGMFNGFSSSPKVINCIFRLNACFFNGGGMANDNSSSPELKNCLFNTNYAGNHGGGVANYKSCNPEITNCTFSGNKARRCGGGISNYGSCYPSLANCIFWSNTAPIKPQIQDLAGSHTTVEYSDIQGGWPGEGNIDADPLFVDPNNGDYHLLPFSLCIDAGDNTAVPSGVTTDLDGNSRFVDDPCTPDTGNGTPPIVDMGAYEANYIEVAMKFTPQVLNPSSKGKWVKAHFVLPEGFEVNNNVDVNSPAKIWPLSIESEYINVFINEVNLVELEIGFDRAAFCAAGIDYGLAEITVIGRLSSGQYFYGTDTIRIIANERK